ncbi:uncharacterized protein LOC119360413 [Triticum dicoccoides]|uniref:uncharacterized protein LOC119360413 n=1 Tax=Triticum dicoccoides TaxID=85692 RepID=UPI00188E98E4|nr:uncharacterized protein LOC119360413 [Triticum dicoccoides]
MLTSLKTLTVESSDGLVEPLKRQGEVEWQLPVECIEINRLNGNSGKELTALLPHLPRLSKLEIIECKNIKQLVVGVDLQQTTPVTSEIEEDEITAAEEENDDGVLLLPIQLCDSLRELEFDGCSEMVLVDPPTHVPGGGWLQALRCVQRLRIEGSTKFLSTFFFSCHMFPSSLQFLSLKEVEGLGTLEPLSNLSSLTRLELWNCGRDLKCQGLWSLLTTGGQLNELKVLGSPRFFAAWDPNPKLALDDVGGEEWREQLASSTLRGLCTDYATGLLTAPICSFLSSLTELELLGYGFEGMEHFSNEQEDALQLLSSHQQLKFSNFHNIQQLPAGLRNLTCLKLLSIRVCPAISSLPSDGLPESLQELNVEFCYNQELKQQCRELVGTIPKVSIR